MRVRIIEPTKKVEYKNKKVCAYARVSTDNIKQGESLENQIQYYENLISNNLDYEYVGVFADRGITGTTDNRPEFQRMMQLAREGKIDLIITKSVSRFARNTAIILETVRELKDLNVEVRFEKQNINTMSGDGELMLAVLSSFAEEESRSVSENLKWRYRRKFEQGEVVINTSRFLGYDKNEYGDLVINQEEAKRVERIFNEYMAGNGVFKIAKILNEEKIPTVTGAKWSQATIYGILRNEKYKGDTKLQKTYTKDHLSKKKCRNNGEVDSFYVEDNHSPIISKEIWDKVQVEMKERASAKGNIAGDTNKYTKRYPLTGMLYCNICGAPLIRRTWNSNNKSKKIVWQCKNYIRNGKKSCTGTKIEDNIIRNVDIYEPTIVKEEIRDGKKYYSYTRKSKQKQPCRNNRATEKENGSILQSVNRPIRTTIKL